MKPILTFLAGAASTAAAVFLAGGQARAGLAIGAGVMILAAVTFPRAIARTLLATADACDQFRESWRQVDLTSTKVDNTRPASIKVDTENQAQRDVIAALRNQGMSAKKARAAVLAAGPIDDFEQLFRKVVTA